MISEHENKLVQKLRKKAYRRAYVSEHVRRGIAHQIRALREEPIRNWNQGELSRRLAKPQSVVSRMEDPSYGKLTIQTLLEVAEAFDVALWVRFVSFPAFIDLTRDLSTTSMRVESFEQSRFSVPVAEPVVVKASTVAASATAELQSNIAAALGAGKRRLFGLDNPSQSVQAMHWAGGAMAPVRYGLDESKARPASQSSQLGGRPVTHHERRAQGALVG